MTLYCLALDSLVHSMHVPPSPGHKHLEEEPSRGGPASHPDRGEGHTGGKHPQPHPALQLGAQHRLPHTQVRAGRALCCLSRFQVEGKLGWLFVVEREWL